MEDIVPGAAVANLTGQVLSRHRVLSALLLMAVVAGVGIVTMPGSLYDGDPLAMRAEANALLQGKLAVDVSLAAGYGSPGQFFVVNPENSCYYSKYGIVNGLFFLPPQLVLRLLGGPGSDTLPSTETALLVYNGYFIVMSVVLALVIFFLAGLYSDSNAVNVGYVLACMYCTFLWYYLRAQTGEILQVILFTGLFITCIKLQRNFAQTRTIARRGLWQAWLFILLLTLQRVSYATLALSFIFLVALMLYRAGRVKLRAATGLALRANVLPLLLLLMVLAVNNHAKFDEVLATGYLGWMPDYHQPLLGDFGNNLLDLLTHPRWSILWLFAPLPFALLCMRGFMREYAFDGAAAAVLTAPNMLLLLSCNLWRGEMCYGPRLFLYFLPVVAVPLAYFLAARRGRISRAEGVMAIILAAALAHGLVKQSVVNYYPFLFDYTYIADPRIPPQVRGYWVGRSFSDAVGEMGKFIDSSRRSQILLAYQHTGTDPAAIAQAQQDARLVFAGVRPNYYFALTGELLRPLRVARADSGE